MVTQSQSRQQLPISPTPKRPPQPSALLGISIGVIIPALLYQILVAVVHTPAPVALLVCSVPGTGWWLVWLLRLRTFDFLASLAPLFLIVKGLLLVSHADTRITQLNVSFVSGIVGLFCLCALFFPHSLLFSFARLLTTGGSLKTRSQFAALWQLSPFRAMMRFFVILWGVTLLLEAGITLLLALLLSPASLATLLLCLNYGVPVVLAQFPVAYWHRAKRLHASLFTQEEKKVLP